MRKVLCVLLCGTITCAVLAQNGDVLFEELARNSDFSGQDLEEMLHARTALNLATRQDLEMSGLLSPYQVASLIDYRERYGEFLTWAEIAIIPGFSGEDVELLSLFFTLEPSDAKFRKFQWNFLIKEGNHSLMLQTRTFFPRGEEYSPITAEEYKARPNSRYLGVPWYRYARYDYRCRNKLYWGITLESDPGERSLADFLSFHIAAKDIRPFKILVAGDFRARFGQGLLLWNGTLFGKVSSTASLCNTETGLTTYTSRDENLFFRGLGATFGNKRMELSVFGSWKPVDARVIAEGFTSLVMTGYHRTPLELEKKKALASWATGINLSYLAENWKVGVTALGYGYGHRYAGKVTYYNAFVNRDLPFGGLSADFSFRSRSWRFFSEIAMDLGLAPAVLGGVIYYGKNGDQAGLLLRCFTPSYTAAYGASLGRNSSSSNEYSLQLTADKNLSRKWKLDGSIWFFLFPAPRYLCHEPSYGWDTRLRLRRDGHMVLVRQQRSLSDKGITDKQLLSLKIGIKISENWMLNLRADGLYSFLHGNPGQWGSAAYAELVCDERKGVFRGSFRVTLFYTGSWESRIYLYESDVLYGFSVPALYGKGIKSYFNFKFSPFKWLDIWFKISCLVRDTITCESKIQARFRF